jgi:maleylpyruvate isomerase
MAEEPDRQGPAPAIVGDLLPEATRRLIRTADGLADEDLATPSGLPGWSRGHVVAHLALNAEGLAAALTGIVEGAQVPIYRSDEARDGDIAELAREDASQLRDRLMAGCTELSDAVAAVPPDRWGTTVERVPGGRTFAAGQVPGMRLREVEIHHVDLQAGYDRTSWDAGFCAHVLDAMVSRAAAAPFRAHAIDLDRSWTYGEGGPTVSGSSADLAWWLTGRGNGEGLTGEDGALPRIGAW